MEFTLKYFDEHLSFDKDNNIAITNKLNRWLEKK